jgi:hypothetical protein
VTKTIEVLNTVFWDVTSRTVMEGYRGFGDTYCLYPYTRTRLAAYTSPESKQQWISESPPLKSQILRYI